jgi:hypothetical protein
MASSPQSQNLLLAALPADDFELLRPNLQTVDMPLGLVLVRSGAIPKKSLLSAQRGDRVGCDAE